MRLLFIGDIVGRPGREMLANWLPKLKQKYQPHVILLNGENSAGGKGLSKKVTRFFYEHGINGITLGNHAWDNKEIFELIQEDTKIIRPANYPEGTPGKGYTYIRHNDVEIGVINLMGRTFLPPLDCPFRTADRILEEMRKRTKIILVDFHAEATAEKQALGWYLDGKVSVVVGTHTHVQTADERILPNGTAYITDVGMVGPADGILGMSREAVLRRFLTQLPVRFEVEQEGKSILNAVIVDIQRETGKALKIFRIQADSNQLEA
jgi:metallophosphoesterase (TIGR00282 family)